MIIQCILIAITYIHDDYLFVYCKIGTKYSSLDCLPQASDVFCMQSTLRVA